MQSLGFKVRAGSRVDLLLHVFLFLSSSLGVGQNARDPLAFVEPVILCHLLMRARAYEEYP